MNCKKLPNSFNGPQKVATAILIKFSVIAFLSASIFTGVANAQIIDFYLQPLYRLAVRPGALYGSVLLDSDHLNPGFFKQLSSPQWRRVTKYGLDNQTPHPFFSRTTITSNILYDAFLSLNYHVSVHVLKESNLAPGLTLGFTHVFGVPISLDGLGLEGENNNFTFNYYMHLISASAIVSKSISHSTKVYAGARYTYEQVDLDFFGFNSKNMTGLIEKNSPTYETSVNFFNGLFYRREHAAQMVVGFAQISTTKNWTNSITMVTDFDKMTNFILEASFHKSFVWGIAVDPAGFLPLRPYFKFRIRFPW